MKFNKKLVYGTGSAMFIAGVCIVIILLNVVATLLSDKFGARIDVSETGMNLSSEFKDFIKTVDKDINVYYLVNPNEIVRLSGNNEITAAAGQIDNFNYRIRIKYMFEKIEQLNSKIHFEIVDPELNPDKVKNFGSVQEDDVVFECGEMINSFNVQEILGTDQVSGRFYMDAEPKTASMIGSVMRETKVKVGIVTGHGEADNSEIKKIFDDEIIYYEDFNILSDGISDEYDLLFIYGPTKDFSVDEINILDEYLTTGKDMQIYLDKVNECPNLVNYMSMLGIQYVDGYIEEKNPENIASVNNGKTYIVPNWNTEVKHPIISSTENVIYVSDTVGIKSLWKQKNDINDVVSLLYTSPYAVKYSNSDSKGETYDIITVSQRITESKILSDVMACGSSHIYDKDVINTNKVILVNSVLWMGREDESSAFASSYVSNPTIVTNESQYNVLQFIFVGVIPFLIIMIGLVVWIKRRYL